MAARQLRDYRNSRFRCASAAAISAIRSGSAMGAATLAAMEAGDRKGRKGKERRSTLTAARSEGARGDRRGASGARLAPSPPRATETDEGHHLEPPAAARGTFLLPIFFGGRAAGLRTPRNTPGDDCCCPPAHADCGRHVSDMPLDRADRPRNVDCEKPYEARAPRSSGVTCTAVPEPPPSSADRSTRKYSSKRQFASARGTSLRRSVFVRCDT